MVGVGELAKMGCISYYSERDGFYPVRWAVQFSICF